MKNYPAIFRNYGLLIYRLIKRKHKWKLNKNEVLHFFNKKKLTQSNKPVPLVALLRVRNESLILQDTLQHLSEFCDYICAYDDASTDTTLDILKSHPKVILIIENKQWLPTTEDRLSSETRHRGILLQETRKKISFTWCMCCDADERYLGPIRTYVTENTKSKPKGVRIQLFDSYLTHEDDLPYDTNKPLLNFRVFFGPERRDILMLWRNHRRVTFQGLDAREPFVPGQIDVHFFCQHYGKSLSYEHWEETCDYYVEHFPWEPYGTKWSARKGKALHHTSDFGKPLYAWGQSLFKNAEKIY
jgi:glycosyltransferase involved in cell wall biosynthesis